MIEVKSFINTGFDERTLNNILKKSKDKSKLVPKEIIITRNGKSFKQTVWVKPDELSREINTNKKNEILSPNISEVQKISYMKSVKNEPAITNDLTKISKEIGGKLVGLEFRLKTQESYARKVNTDVIDKNLSEEEVVKNIFDTVRYTTLFSANNLVKNYANNIEKLKEKGYNLIRVKNTFNNIKSAYKGINVVLESPTGEKFELQFHTEESFELKQNKLHEMYEESRLTSTSKERKEELDKQMLKMSNEITIPKNIDKI